MSKGLQNDVLLESLGTCYGNEFEQASGVGDGQGGLACYSPWGRRESGHK